MNEKPFDPNVKMDDRDHEQVIQVFRHATSIILNDARRQGSTIRLPRRGRILVTGDLHDNPISFRQIVRLAELEKSVDHHVVLHELIHGERLINGLDLSYRMLMKVAQLVSQYPGQVHPLLANHELSQMAGHPISKGSGEMTGRFEEGVDWVFGEHGPAVSMAISEFIAAMPLALIGSNGLFCAHSLPGPSQMSRFNPEVINRPLCDQDYAPLVGSGWMMVWGRGQTAKQMEELAKIWEISLFCLGHAYVENGIEIGGPRTIILNTDHDRAVVLPISLVEPAPKVEEALFSALSLAAYGDLV